MTDFPESIEWRGRKFELITHPHGLLEYYTNDHVSPMIFIVSVVSPPAGDPELPRIWSAQVGYGHSYGLPSPTEALEKAFSGHLTELPRRVVDLEVVKKQTAILEEHEV